MSAFAIALFLLGTGGARADSTDGTAASEAAIFAVAEMASPKADSLEDALALLSSSSQASDSDNESEELCTVGTVARCSNREMRPGRTLAHRWHPHNAGAPPVPPPQGPAEISWTKAEVTDLAAWASSSGPDIGPNSKPTPRLQFSEHFAASIFERAPSIRNAGTRDFSRRRSPARRVILSSSESFSRPLARASACASERLPDFVRVSTPISMTIKRWGTS